MSALELINTSCGDRYMLGSKEDGRQAIVTLRGRVTYRIWYTAILGGNSTSWERQHTTLKAAMEDAQKWFEAIGRAMETSA